MPEKRDSPNTKSGDVFGQARRPAKMFQVWLYAGVSTNDQQTLAMQNRAMREYAARRGWTIALQVREMNSGAAKREARENLLEECIVLPACREFRAGSPFTAPISSWAAVYGIG